MPTQLDHYRLLGRSGLRVSPLSLGTMTFGVSADAWGTSEADIKSMVGQYIERGGNFIDTANFYGGAGGSERALAPLIREHRERVVLATKYSLSMRPKDPNGAGNHRKNLVQSVEASLKRLETDYIDLLYLHVWDGHTPVDEVLRGFDDLIRAGKVVYAGISDTPAWQVSRMNAIADLRGWSAFVALQIPYSLAERTVEREYMPMALEMGLGVLPWSPLAGGVLSGKYSRADLQPATGKFDLTSRKTMNVATGRLSEHTLAIAEEVKAIAGELGVSPSQIALAWTLLNPAVASPIIGARTMQQFEDNLGALNIAFDDAQIARLDAVSRIPMDFPHSMLNGPMAGALFGGAKIAPRH